MAGKVAVFGCWNARRERLADSLGDHQEQQAASLDAACHRARRGRNHHPHRLAAVVHQPRHGYTHNVIDHAEAYVDGTSTPTTGKLLESPEARHQGHLREHRTIHLFRYLDEQAFRFNHRKGTDATRFVLALKGILDKRLTYSALTGRSCRKTC